MKSNLPDRGLVREYLLGRLDDKKEIEDHLSDEILFNDEVAEMVESIEDEIIEEFLDGTLNSADKKAVDEYFLQPPARKEKLRFARLLRHHFEKEQDRFVKPSQDVLPVTGRDIVQHQADSSLAVHWRSHFGMYAQFAALILVSVLSLIYISGVRKSHARLEAELARERERERSESLAQEARLLQSPMVPLTLVSDRSRGDETQIPHLEIKPSTQRIIVEIALHGTSSGSYDVRLEGKGEKGPIWSARLLALVSPSGDARLMFDVPVQGIESGVYSFVVSSDLPGVTRPKYYDFQVKLTR
jgi:hypothetical protein